jgi:hypothetical protein
LKRVRRTSPWLRYDGPLKLDMYIFFSHVSPFCFKSIQRSWHQPSAPRTSPRVGLSVKPRWWDTISANFLLITIYDPISSNWPLLWHMFCIFVSDWDPAVQIGELQRHHVKQEVRPPEILRGRDQGVISDGSTSLISRPPPVPLQRLARVMTTTWMDGEPAAVWLSTC